MHNKKALTFVSVLWIKLFTRNTARLFSCIYNYLFKRKFNIKTEKNPSMGFTLLEVTVVVAIIGILAVIVAVRWGSISKTEKIKAEKLKLESTIKEMQSMSFAPRSDSLTEEIKWVGYGVHVYKDGLEWKVLSFKDSKDSGIVGKYDGSSIDNIISEYKLTKEFRINFYWWKSETEGMFVVKDFDIVFISSENIQSRNIYVWHTSTTSGSLTYDCNAPCIYQSMNTSGNYNCAIKFSASVGNANDPVFLGDDYLTILKSGLITSSWGE